jgi:ABC-2 type transport system permease protein
MPRPLELISEHQPYTPLIETLRGLLLGTPVGSTGWLAVAWFGAILALGMASATALFRRQAA